ncbi:hypothetical protein [Acinetobacter bereziniae]|uniref:hypothetical protein n=1 Tax=Acinetobacter bereziniae TaxID=106648 RepID=UPI00300BCB0C
MNRKQKKNKQRIAREHTKKQGQVHMTPKEMQDVYERNTSQNKIDQDFIFDLEEPKFYKGFKVGIWLAFFLAIIWIFYHFLG